MKKYFALVLFTLTTSIAFAHSGNEKITKEPIKIERIGAINSTVFEPGYKGIVEMGYSFGKRGYNYDMLKLNIINGYQLNPYFSIGFGTGLRYILLRSRTLVPVFADFRSIFTENKVSPYLSLAVGYSFNTTINFNGYGFLLNPTAGVIFKVSNKTALNVGIGYDLQKSKHYYNINAISINVGIAF
jgi:outer membrane protein assembly factor BamA